MQENWIDAVSYGRAMSAPCLTGRGLRCRYGLRDRLFLVSVSKALAEVFRVLRKGGCFLISLEASDPELGKAWTDRIKGMTVYGAEDLKRLLSKAGFSDIRMIQKKEELHIIAHK